ncbi:MAG: bifunctional phosphoribosyl-AMP cyclohydrolase/phosphoribosyl-ATP diphosphatase HisIE [Steroidobacteraceae bacterium]
MTLSNADIARIKWDAAGLIPAVVQDAVSGAVLMLAWMNAEALQATRTRGKVVFFSRSRQKLWEKGETSGHTLNLVDLQLDCDGDTLLVLANPIGPTCHTGTPTCFGEPAVTGAGELAFLAKLEGIVAQRIAENPDQSYTAKLYQRGVRRMAQKVGEEGLEVALAAVAQGDEELLGESADLLFHLLVLLKSRDLRLPQVVAELQHRHMQKGD